MPLSIPIVGCPISPPTTAPPMVSRAMAAPAPRGSGDLVLIASA